MFTTSYKLNNSYTTYVIHDFGVDMRDNYTYIKPPPKLEWKKDAKVSNYFYGTGKICDISSHRVTVHFRNDKAQKKMRNILVSFEYNNAPSEIDGLRLCY